MSDAKCCVLIDVAKYCKTCTTCKCSKPPNQKLYGLLNPLSISSNLWKVIRIDFTGLLLKSSNQNDAFDSITVVICLLTEKVHLIPSWTDYTAIEIAVLVFSEIYKLHGLPRAIVSDQDVLFTNLFWTHLHKLSEIKLCISSTYHPESDGFTEWANCTIMQMLQ